MSNISSTNSSPSTRPRSLLECVFGLLSDTEQGGFAPLLNDFTAAGQGEIIASWVGADENLPTSPLLIRQGMGEARIQWLADAANVQ